MTVGGDKVRFCVSKMGRRFVCILSLVCLRLQFKFLLKIYGKQKFVGGGGGKFLASLKGILN